MRAAWCLSCPSQGERVLRGLVPFVPASEYSGGLVPFVPATRLALPGIALQRLLSSTCPQEVFTVPNPCGTIAQLTKTDSMKQRKKY